MESEGDMMLDEDNNLYDEDNFEAEENLIAQVDAKEANNGEYIGVSVAFYGRVSEECKGFVVSEEFQGCYEDVLDR